MNTKIFQFINHLSTDYKKNINKTNIKYIHMINNN